MAKKAKPNLRPNYFADVTPFGRMGTPAALDFQQQLNDLLIANPNLSSSDLTRLLVEAMRQQADLRGNRLDSISDQAAAFAEQLAKQAKGGGVAGVIQPPEIQRQFQFRPDETRPFYYRPRPLADALEAAADQGVAWGVGAANKDWSLSPSGVARRTLDEGNDFVRQLQESLIADGIPGAELVPLSQGVYSTAFSSPLTDEVVKLTFNGPRQYINQADGAWGVLSPRKIGEIPASVGEFAYSISPRADIGRATRADHDTLKKALTDQGYWWDDDHMGNMGMLPGNEYRPVVIDAGDVKPTSLNPQVKWPFSPPTGPLYNWLIPALAAGGTTALATLGGQQQAEAGTRGRGLGTWHGSGADFDSLNPEKALSGAGGAIYSPGWYSAENPATAQSFDNGWMYRFLIDGDPQEFLNWHDSIDNQPEVRNALERAGLPTSNRQSDVVRALIGRFNPSAIGVDNLEALGILSRAVNDYPTPSPANQRLLGSFGLQPVDSSGTLYEVDQGIDYTKDGSRPLVSGRNISLAADDLRRRVAFSGDDSIAPRGEEVWDELARHFQPAHRRWVDGQTAMPPWEVRQRANPGGAAAMAMAEAGIPGIRYRDLSSRGPSVTDPTYNYVVNYPNTDRIEIADKKRTNYNWLIPALAAGGAAAVGTLGSQPQATAVETLSMEPQPMGPITLSAGTDGQASQPLQGDGGGGSDFSMAISPDEWSRWYDNPEAGYGGEEHQQFQAAVQKTMDVPSIPERYITERLNVPKDMWEKYFPGYQGGDMTPRQFAQGASWLVIMPAFAKAQEEANNGVQDGPYAKTFQAMTIPGISGPLANDIVAEFSGTSRDRGDKATELAVDLLLNGIASGVSGGPYAERDEVTRSEDKRLRQSFAKEGKEGESEFYVTPGGQQNYRREASLQLLRTMQDGALAPPGMTSMDYVGNRLFDQTVGNIQRVAGEEYNPRAVPGFGRADWRADNLMDSSAPRGRMAIALDLYNRTPEWARSSAAQAQERDIQNQNSSQTMREANAEVERALAGRDGMSPDLSAALLNARPRGTADKDARLVGYRQVNPDAVDRFDTGTAAGLSNVLYNNQSFTPAQYAQWFDPILGQVNDRISLGNDSGSFTRQMNRDLDSVRRVRGDRESEEQFDKRASWYADKKAADRDYRSAYWGPYSADLANQALGGDVTGKKFDRTFLSPTADFAANFGQDFARNPYNYATIAASAVGGGAGGLIRGGVGGAVKGAGSGAFKGFGAELLDEGREEAALQLGSGMFDFTPQDQNAFARDFDAPQDQWVGGKPPQLDPNDPDYWKKFGRAYQGHQGRAAGYYDSWKRGLLD